MRLNGRREIMAHFGRRFNPKDCKAWKKIRRRYVEVLYYLPGSFRVWTTSEELDALDRKRSLMLEGVRAAKARTTGGTVRGNRGGEGHQRVGRDAWPVFERLVGELYPGGVRQKKRG